MVRRGPRWADSVTECPPASHPREMSPQPAKRSSTCGLPAACSRPSSQRMMSLFIGDVLAWSLSGSASCPWFSFRKRCTAMQVLQAEESPATLLRKWIALLPSRNPGKRELHALRAISAELAQLKADVGVALVYGTKFSEEIADIFALQGVNTTLLLPFGVLTRKTLGKRVAVRKSGALTIASTAAASESWSRQLFAQSMDALRLNANTVLRSDPEPDWLSNKELTRWGRTPISYVRYETMSPSMREALANFGAKPIGRRGETGAPNIDFLVSTFGDAVPAAARLDDFAASSTANDVAESATEMYEEDLTHAAGQVFSVKIDQKSHETRRLLLETIFDMSVEEIAVRLPSNASEDDRERLLMLGFNLTEP